MSVRAQLVPAGGVADHRGEVADDEDDRVPEVLELPHLLHQHGVAEVQIGARRVEAGLDPERPPGAEALLELGADVEVDDTAAEDLDLAFGGEHARGLSDAAGAR